MTTIIEEAISTLSSSVNLSTGLTHPNDMNKARELFKILSDNGEVLLKSEVASTALGHGWLPGDADELGSLAQQIGEGKKPHITGGPWWAADIYDKIAART